MIDNRDVRVRWVCVKRLALCVEEVQLLIGIGDGKECGSANSGALLRHTGFQALKVVRLVHLFVIHVTKLV